MPALVSSDWLAGRLTEVRIIDASWHMPSEGRDAQAEFVGEHIPSAVFIDIDALSDQESPFPHMLPSSQAFAEKMNALGIQNRDHIVIYDSKGMFSAPRLWWMFRVFGHNQVSVLDGGLPKWKAEGRELASRSKARDMLRSAQHESYRAMLQPKLLRTFEQMKINTLNPKEEVIDARSAARFNGEVPEPREGLRSGHIPGSKNLPFSEVLTPPYQIMRTPPELQALFMQAGIDLDKPVVTSCGSGVTACILALALHEVGKKDVAVYDGSWAEWGKRA